MASSDLDSEETDVLIVGAGPTGAVVARRLADESGVKVVCLEQGDWPDYSRARAGHLEFELVAGRDWQIDPNARGRAEDYPIDDSESDVTAMIYNAVGGGSVVYAAKWHRVMPSDLRTRSLEGVGTDWPLAYDELTAFYDRVDRDFAVSGLGGDPAYPPSADPPMEHLPLRRAGLLVARAHNRLGWHWWPAANAIASRPYGRLGACTQRGTCTLGCVEHAKASVDLTHWPDAVRRGVKLITGARVRQLITKGGRVAGAVYVDHAGVERMQRARLTVLCANAIGTARLLLLSASSEHPEGLANRSGLVGKRLMMHPLAAVAGAFEEELDSWHGAWGQQIYSMQFYRSDESRGFVRGAKWGLQPTGGPVAVTRSYPWASAHDVLWGSSFHDQLARRLGRSALWTIVGEDLPEEGNQVSLSSELVDSHGIPAPKIRYTLSDNTRRLLDYHTERAAESLLEAGATTVLKAPFVKGSGWHLFGTAAMGADPATSVVDRWGQSHDVPNLFILDGSIWPTSSGVNPTATMAALALRGAERIISVRRTLPVSS